MTDVIWLGAILIAALGPMLHATFSPSPAVKSAKYRAFTFMWPFAVLSSLPLLWTDELSPQLLAVTLITFIAVALCSGILLFRHRHGNCG